MLQQITKGIRVTVASRYHGTVFHNKITRHAFAYHIAIENQGKNAVQLLTRHWKVQEALDPNSIVSGEGIVGKSPCSNLEKPTPTPPIVTCALLLG